jgi:muconolactone D-isomerase
VQPDLGGTGGSTSEFLVRMENLLPASFPADERARLLQAEADRARELASAGILVRLWRVAGRRANAGIWRAATTGELHDALASLPLFPYLDIEVIPLSRHPNDPQR